MSKRKPKDPYEGILSIPELRKLAEPDMGLVCRDVLEHLAALPPLPSYPLLLKRPRRRRQQEAAS